MGLTKLVFRRPVSAVLILLAIAVFGIGLIPSFKLELMPDIEYPMMVVVTVYPGADPVSVEELVTDKIESVGSVLEGVTKTTSYSSENFGATMFSYDYDMDMDDAYIDMRAALDTARADLPSGIEAPYIMELSMTAEDTVTISATAADDIDVLAFVNDVAVPRLETVMGVGDVTVSGGRQNYFKIELDPSMMNQYGLNIASIAQFLAAIDFTYPTGSVNAGSQEMSIISTSRAKTIPDLQNVPIVTSTGGVIKLSDVANIYESSHNANSISRYNGNPDINIGVTKKQAYGTVNVAAAAKKAVAELNAQNPQVDLRVIYDSSKLIVDSLMNVGETLVIGIALTMFVLFLFFGDIKASLIVGSTMPVSLFATIIAMWALGFTINVVTIGALVIAVGMIVDCSIVVIESIFRIKDEEADINKAALKGTRIVMQAVIASTLTTIVVYFPLSIMSGLVGQIFGQLGFTIIIALIASLICSISLIPLFFAKYKPKEKKELPINKLLAAINRIYEKNISKILDKKITAVITALALLGISVALIFFINAELIPTTQDRTINVTATFRPGTRIEFIDKQIGALEEEISAFPNVENVSVVIGGSGGILGATSSSNSARISAYIDKSLPPKEVAAAWKLKYADIADMDLSIEAAGSFMGMSGADMGMASGATVSISGYSLPELKEAALIIEDEMRKNPRVIKAGSDISSTSTRAEISVDPLKAMNVGLTPIQVAMTLNSTLSGVKAVTLKDVGKETDVRIEFPEGLYDDINALLDIYLSTPYGILVPLSDIAEVKYVEAPQMLTRVNGEYQVTVSATNELTDSAAAKKEIDRAIEALIKDLKLPEGVHLSQSLEEEMMAEEFSGIYVAIAVAVFLVFLVMAMQFESPRFSAMVMLSVPFALIGSLFLLFITRATFSMVSLMGILMLTGIVVNNGILYVDTVNQLRLDMPLKRALIRSGQLRLRPILMTTLTTILSMIPLALGIGNGGKIMQGMALVIIGGLISSTILVLILMPTFYLIINGKKGLEREAELELIYDSRIKSGEAAEFVYEDEKIDDEV